MCALIYIPLTPCKEDEALDQCISFYMLEHRYTFYCHVMKTIREIEHRFRCCHYITCYMSEYVQEYKIIVTLLSRPSLSLAFSVLLHSGNYAYIIAIEPYCTWLETRDRAQQGHLLLIRFSTVASNLQVGDWGGELGVGEGRLLTGFSLDGSMRS